MNHILNVLAPTRYPWRFNGPRATRHNISIRNFLPFNKISSKIEGITIFNPLPIKRFDLIHAFNRIPISLTPYIIGFESHLPRAFGLENSLFSQLMIASLASKRCKSIIAISEYARRQFLRQHMQSSYYEVLAKKLIVKYPNFPIPSELDTFQCVEADPIRLVFVGNHFGRKGGTVALRLAERAYQAGLSIQVDIVSSLELGYASWVGPIREDYWKKDLELLSSLPNVRHYSHLPNSEVIALVRNAHFVLLPTFSDSFGYSAIESMAFGTPVVGTKQCALPEFIHDGFDGILLDLDTDQAGEWSHINRTDRASPEYEMLFESEVNRLTEEAYTKILSIVQFPDQYLALRSSAKQTANNLFSASTANDFWDNFYCETLNK